MFTIRLTIFFTLYCNENSFGLRYLVLFGAIQNSHEFVCCFCCDVDQVIMRGDRWKIDGMPRGRGLFSFYQFLPFN